MSELRFEAMPYDEAELLRFHVFASSAGFSGSAEIYASRESIARFGAELIDFPRDLQHTVSFQYGNGSDEWPYHVVLRAQVMDNSGHSAVCVRIQSFCSPIEAALCELFVPADPAAINQLGRHIADWSSNPDEPVVWQPRT